MHQGKKFYYLKTHYSKPGMVVHTCNSSTQEVEAGGSRFKINLNYMASSGPIWDTWDAVSNNKKELQLIKIVCALSGQLYNIKISHE